MINNKLGIISAKPSQERYYRDVTMPSYYDYDDKIGKSIARERQLIDLVVTEKFITYVNMLDHIINNQEQYFDLACRRRNAMNRFYDDGFNLLNAVVDLLKDIDSDPVLKEQFDAIVFQRNLTKDSK